MLNRAYVALEESPVAARGHLPSLLWGQSRFRLSAGADLALHPTVACLEEAGVRL